MGISMKLSIGIIVFYVAAALIVMAALVWLLHRYITNAVERRTLVYQSDLMEKHCDEVRNMYRQTRGWRHDYHNHIQSMKAYLAMGRMDELDRYLNELDKDLTTVDTVIKTGNVMIDAILNSKISLAKSRKIAVDAKAIVPGDLELSITEIDLSLIIGNLMDNAMEACMKIETEEDRFIRVYIDILKGQLYIYVMNSAIERAQRVGRLYRSTKGGSYHGLGLMRVDRVVDRYNGYLDRQDEEGVFATEIMLPLAGEGL